jgi:hypothetical protein
LLALAAAGCAGDAPLPTASHMSHDGGVMLSDLARAGNAQTLAALRQFTAQFHDLDAATAAGYGLLKAPPATAQDGCISDANIGGMGYHYTRGNNLGDDAIDLLDPEFLVYAPTDAPSQDGVARRRLAAVEYFIPFSDRWPAPVNAADPRATASTKGPSLHDFPSTSSLPDVAFTPTARFGGWMLHIWRWEDNPAGMFVNFNQSVPLCWAAASGQ